jgi:hypothetical protein
MHVRYQTTFLFVIRNKELTPLFQFQICSTEPTPAEICAESPKRCAEEKTQAGNREKPWKKSQPKIKAAAS